MQHDVGALEALNGLGEQGVRGFVIGQ